MEQDRAAVQAAFDAVRPGGIVQFAAGTYLLGAGVYLKVPDVVVLGHSAGTVLRGCEPAAFDIAESGLHSLVMGCAGFYVQAERQTVRHLTFEYAWHGIVIGPYPASIEELAATQGILPPFPVGGQRIEGNTFRAMPNGMRVLGVDDDVSIVRDNDFIDTFHAIGMYGPPVEFVGNRVRVEDPARVPTSHHPGNAVLVGSSEHTDCGGHVIADNLVEGHPGAIYVLAMGGRTCRDVEVRNNTIRVARVRLPGGWVIPPTATDSTLVGVPITIAALGGQEPEPAGSQGAVEGIVVRGNHILGAEGIGILVGGSRARILDNHISDIRIREPFPGNNWSRSLVTWEQGNGSGIWVAPSARENQIAGTVFARIEGAAITLEGGANEVRLLAPADTTRDLGEANRVVRPPVR